MLMSTRRACSHYIVAIFYKNEFIDNNDKPVAQNRLNFRAPWIYQNSCLDQFKVLILRTSIMNGREEIWKY